MSNLENATQYSVTFVNNSSLAENVCIFQQDPNLGVSNAMSLAWLTQPAVPGTTLTLSWTTNYSFLWAETGPLQPGVTFTAGQTLDADLNTLNQVTFTREAVGQSFAYTFQGQQPAPEPGTLYIIEDSSIPVGAVSVGVGMSGSGTFAVQAEPNFNLTFTPNPEYWIAFGSFTPGLVMSVSEMSNPQQIIFPPNVYAVTATLSADNTWTVSPS